MTDAHNISRLAALLESRKTRVQSALAHAQAKVARAKDATQTAHDAADTQAEVAKTYVEKRFLNRPTRQHTSSFMLSVAKGRRDAVRDATNAQITANDKTEEENKATETVAAHSEKLQYLERRRTAFDHIMTAMNETAAAKVEQRTEDEIEDINLWRAQWVILNH